MAAASKALLTIGILTAVGVAAWVSQAWWMSFVPGTNAHMASVCTSVLRERLMVPSSLKITRLQANTRRFTHDEYASYLQARMEGSYAIETPATAALELKSFDVNTQRGLPAGPEVFEAVFDVEASNAMGVPVASTHTCQSVGGPGYSDELLAYTLKLDGKTKTEWLVEQTNSLPQ